MSLAANPLPARRGTTEPQSLLRAFEKAEIGEGCRDWRILADGGIEFACDHADPLIVLNDVDIESRPETWIHVEVEFEHDLPAGVELPKQFHAQRFFGNSQRPPR